MLASGSMATPFLAYVAALRYPQMKVVLVSWIYQDPASTPIWIRLLFGLHILLSVVVIWAGMLANMVVIMLPVASTLFLLSEIQ